MTNQKYRPTITRSNTRSQVFSIEDALNIDKFRFSATYTDDKRKGKDYVSCYINSSNFRAVASIILSGNFGQICPADRVFNPSDGEKVVASYVVRGGSPSSPKYNGNPESRMIDISALVKPDGSSRWVIMLKQGEGELMGKGAIKPKDMRQMISQTFFLDHFTMRKMLLDTLAHLEAYEASNFGNLFNENGKRTKNRVDQYETDNRAFQKDQELADTSDTDYYEADDDGGLHI